MLCENVLSLPTKACFNPFSELNFGEHLQPAAAEPCSPAPAPAAAAEDGEHAGKQCKAIPAALTPSEHFYHSWKKSLLAPGARDLNSLPTKPTHGSVILEHRAEKVEKVEVLKSSCEQIILIIYTVFSSSF